jgi:hypothetical protein
MTMSPLLINSGRKRSSIGSSMRFAHLSMNAWSRWAPDEPQQGFERSPAAAAAAVEESPASEAEAAADAALRAADAAVDAAADAPSVPEWAPRQVCGHLRVKGWRSLSSDERTPHRLDQHVLLEADHTRLASAKLLYWLSAGVGWLWAQCELFPR